MFDVYASQHKGDGKKTDQGAILDELISLEVMHQEGMRKGLNKDERVVATLDQQQRSEVASAEIKDFMANNPVSDKEARKMYDSEYGVGSTEYNARHILVKSKDEAEQIIDLLSKGADFQELAKEKSTGPLRVSGGKLGWFGAKQMVAPFSAATAKLEKGSYTKEPVQTTFGWHVILLEDTRQSKPPPFNDIKERLKLVLANKKLSQHINKLRESADIEIVSK